MTELKRCPFCGATAVLVSNCDPANGKLLYYVMCEGCSLESQVKTEDKEDAIGYWNYRPIEDDLRTSISKLEAENKEIEEEKNSFIRELQHCSGLLRAVSKRRDQLKAALKKLHGSIKEAELTAINALEYETEDSKQ